MNSVSDEIYELIIDRLNGELSASEEWKVNAWLHESLENAEFYEEVKQFHQKLKSARIVFNPEVESALRKVKRRRFGWLPVFRSVYKYAAILLLFIGVTFLAFYFLSEDHPSGQRNFSEIARPGGYKALLRLSSGKYVPLDSASCGTLISEESGVRIMADSNRVLNYARDTGKKEGEERWNTLSVPSGGEYTLILSDGTKVWLNSSTELTYPESFPAGRREVRLSGEAFFQVTADASSPFIVNVREMKVNVLGTAFNVNAYIDNDLVVTTLVRGSVGVTSGRCSSLHLTPGEQALWSPFVLVKRQVSVQQYISWIDGKFIFNNTDLGEICKQLSRWYDVNLSFADDQLKNVRFSGAIVKFRPLEDLIGMIEKTSSVHFQVKGKNIIVSSSAE